MAISSWMNKDMAERLDPLFPEMGGLIHLREVRERFVVNRGPIEKKDNATFFGPEEIGHVRKVLALLGDDEEAKSTIMDVIAFAHMKNDVSGW